MMKRHQDKWTIFRLCRLLCVALLMSTAMLATDMVSPWAAIGATAEEIDRDVDTALEKLYATTPAAKELAKSARGILIFPKVIKGGLIIGGQYGVGALRIDGKTAGYYDTVAASYGLQIGGQTFGYAMFFITASALDYLHKSKGWEFGAGPSVVIVDEGVAKSLTTSTAKDDIYAFFFGEKGLMAGLGLQGSKISKITPDNK